MNLRKTGKVFTSKFVGTGPSSYEKRIYRAAVSRSLKNTGIGFPNKSARCKVRAIVVLLGLRHWNFNICHLSFLRLVVMERYRREQGVIIVNNLLQH